MSTTYSDLHRPKPYTWLLGDESVISEPPLEISASGRRVRVKGTTTSVYPSDIDNLLRDAAREIAREKQTCVWMSLSGAQGTRRRLADSCRTVIRDDEELLSQSSSRWHELNLYWRFEHPSLPIGATVVLRLVNVDPSNLPGGDHRLGLFVEATETEPGAAMWSYSMLACNGLAGPHSNYAVTEKARELLRQSYPEVHDAVQQYSIANAVTVPTHSVGGLRTAAQRALRLIDLLEDLAVFPVMDYRDETGGTHFDLPRVSSNVSDALIARLQGLGEGGEQRAARLHETYMAFRAELSNSGLVLPDLGEDALVALINNHGNGRVEVTHSHGDAGAGHVVEFGLVDGIMRVTCPVGNADDAWAAWQEAVTVASLTGQEQDFRDFALKFAETAAKRGRL